MKKLIALILILACAVSSACADVSSDLYWKYIAYAEMFGAPMFEQDGVTLRDKDKNTYQAEAGPLLLIFEITDAGIIKTVLVCAKDDSCAADFLCSCEAMITFLGKTDLTAYGTALSQFSFLRTGQTPLMGMSGSDSFNMMSNDDYAFIFVYMNTDLSK